MRRNTSPIRLLFATLAVFGVVAASCGSSGTDTGTIDTGTTDTVASDTDTGTTETVDSSDGVLPTSDYVDSYTLTDTEFGTMVTVTVDGSTRTIETNALPDHDTGEFPNDGNPNTISAQDLTYEYPVEAVYTGNSSTVRTTGVAVNGVKFEPGTAETLTCSSGETYRIEALQDVYNLGLDFNNAHVQPTGEYHYHGVSELLADAFATDTDLVHVGFAADGFLMYYSKSGAYESGYDLSTSERAGTDCVATGPAGITLDVEGTTPDGTYTSDWVYDDATGDLDECNGITIDGQYVYLITNEFPYVGRCLNGEAAGEAGAAAGATGGLEPPDLTDAAAALGVSVPELEAALGLPPDVDAAAATLGVTVDELVAVLPAPPDAQG